MIPFQLLLVSIMAHLDELPNLIFFPWSTCLSMFNKMPMACQPLTDHLPLIESLIHSTPLMFSQWSRCLLSVSITVVFCVVRTSGT